MKNNTNPDGDSTTPDGDSTTTHGNPLSTGNDVVDAVGQMHFEGNIVDHRWRLHPLLKKPSGLLNGPALDALSDIVYWFRPVLVRDSHTNQIVAVRKKFTGDEFWKDYRAWAESLGLSERQLRDAVAFLKKQGIIKFRSEPVLLSSGARTNNVPIIEIIPEKLREITYGVDTPHARRRKGGSVKTGDPLRHGERPLAPQRETASLLENTHERQTKKHQQSADSANDSAAPDDVDDFLLKKMLDYGASRTRAMKALRAAPDEMRRRIDLLERGEQVTNRGGWLCSNVDTEYKPSKELIERETWDVEQARAKEEHHKKETAAAAQAAARKAEQDTNDELDGFIKQMPEKARQKLEAAATARAPRVMERPPTPTAILIEMRAILREQFSKKKGKKSDE